MCRCGRGQQAHGPRWWHIGTHRGAQASSGWRDVWIKRKRKPGAQLGSGPARESAWAGLEEVVRGAARSSRQSVAHWKTDKKEAKAAVKAGGKEATKRKRKPGSGVGRAAKQPKSGARARRAFSTRRGLFQTAQAKPRHGRSAVLEGEQALELLQSVENNRPSLWPGLLYIFRAICRSFRCGLKKKK
jgi:hypothetical protein